MLHNPPTFIARVLGRLRAHPHAIRTTEWLRTDPAGRAIERVRTSPTAGRTVAWLRTHPAGRVVDRISTHPVAGRVRSAPRVVHVLAVVLALALVAVPLRGDARTGGPTGPGTGEPVAAAADAGGGGAPSSTTAPASPGAAVHAEDEAGDGPAPMIGQPAADVATPADAVMPASRGAIPVGKGMWLWQPEEIEGGDPDRIVARAQAAGLTHIYVRTGSSRMGFYAQAFLNEILPRAHAAGIRVYGWDFPYLHDQMADISRSVEAITYVTPTGERIDGFVPDIETPSEGTALTPQSARAYSEGLRNAVGPDYPLIIALPRPSPQMQQRFPYDAVVPYYDAIAPMTYWLNRQPDSDVINDLTFLSRYGKPIIPIGQAYDGAPEGGRPGPPPPDEIRRFIAAAEAYGAVGVSFWSWQHATPEIWATIAASEEFAIDGPLGVRARAGQIRSVQALLDSIGFATPVSGQWQPETIDALRAFQEAAQLPVTGAVDRPTRDVLLRPFGAPLPGW